MDINDVEFGPPVPGAKKEVVAILWRKGSDTILQAASNGRAGSEFYLAHVLIRNTKDRPDLTEDERRACEIICRELEEMAAHFGYDFSREKGEFRKYKNPGETKPGRF